MKSKDSLAAIRSELQGAVDPTRIVCEDTVLADLGMSSLHVISVALTLQRKYGLSVDRMIERGMPTTVGDLAGLLENGPRTPG